MPYDQSRERVKTELGVFDPNPAELDKGSRLHASIKSYVDDDGEEGKDCLALSRVLKKGDRHTKLGWLSLEEGAWLHSVLEPLTRMTQ